jgi:hypothetical protein
MQLQRATANATKFNTNLRQFGLNPREWLIRPQTKGLFKLQHRHKSSFQLEGKGMLTIDGIIWEQLSLSSL